MDKQEYIENLKKQLRNETYETVCQIIDYYQEMIDDLMEDGYTEQEAILKLENVQDVVHNIRGEPTYQIKKMNKHLKIGLSILLFILFPLWGTVLAAFLMILLCLYIVIWCFPFISGSITISGIVVFIVGIFGAFPLFMTSYALGLMQLGISAMAGGLGLLCMMLTYISYQKIIHVSQKLTYQVKVFLINIFRKVGVLC